MNIIIELTSTKEIVVVPIIISVIFILGAPSKRTVKWNVIL